MNISKRVTKLNAVEEIAGSEPEFPHEYEQILRGGGGFWDDVNGGYLPEDLVLTARREIHQPSLVIRNDPVRLDVGPPPSSSSHLHHSLPLLTSTVALHLWRASFRQNTLWTTIGHVLVHFVRV